MACVYMTFWIWTWLKEESNKKEKKKTHKKYKTKKAKINGKEDQNNISEDSKAVQSALRACVCILHFKRYLFIEICLSSSLSVLDATKNCFNPKPTRGTEEYREFVSMFDHFIFF